MLGSESLFDEKRNNKTRTNEGIQQREKHTHEKDETTTNHYHKEELNTHIHTQPTRRWTNQQLTRRENKKEMKNDEGSSIYIVT